MFSPKVLDRAGVMEFRVTADEMQNFLRNPAKTNLSRLGGLGAIMASDFMHKANDKASVYDKADELRDILLAFFIELKKNGSEFGYRTASEIFRFAYVINKFSENSQPWPVEKIADAAIMQKLLPRVHGSRRRLEPVLRTLITLCLTDRSMTNIEQLLSSEEDDFTGDATVRFPISLEKLKRLYKRVIQDGFTSFAEA
jgi:5-methylcytosine-specific restriction enzyme B